MDTIHNIDIFAISYYQKKKKKKISYNVHANKLLHISRFFFRKNLKPTDSGYFSLNLVIK